MAYTEQIKRAFPLKLKTVVSQPAVFSNARIRWMVLNDEWIHNASLAVILVTALVVRVVYINSLGYNSDEAVYAGQGAAIARVPHLTELFPVFRAHPLLFQFLVGAAFKVAPYDWVGRLLSVGVGLATIFVVYLLGRQLYGRQAGLYAALFMSVMPYHVIVTRQVLLDGPMTFCATLTLYLLARFGLSEKPIWLIAAAASMGLTFLAKEIGILMIASIYVFLALSPELKVRIHHLIVSFMTMILLMSPFSLASTLAGAKSNKSAGSYLIWQLFRRPNHTWDFYLTVVPPAIGILIIIAAIFGLLYLRRQNGWREKLMLSWIIVPVVFFQLWPTKGFQYLLPIAPAIVLLAVRTLTILPRNDIIFGKSHTRKAANDSLMLWQLRSQPIIRCRGIAKAKNGHFISNTHVLKISSELHARTQSGNGHVAIKVRARKASPDKYALGRIENQPVIKCRGIARAKNGNFISNTHVLRVSSKLRARTRSGNGHFALKVRARKASPDKYAFGHFRNRQISKPHRIVRHGNGHVTSKSNEPRMAGGSHPLTRAPSRLIFEYLRGVKSNLSGRGDGWRIPRWVPGLVYAIVAAVMLLMSSWQMVKPAQSDTFLAGQGGIPGGREMGLWVRENVPEGARFMTIGPSMANIVKYYGYREAFGLSVSPNPLHRNPSYEPVYNPDFQIRTGDLQYVVWDSFSAGRSSFFSEKLLWYVERYHGRVVHMQTVTVEDSNGDSVEKPVIIIYEVHP